jgi:hypothetical protein
VWTDFIKMKAATGLMNDAKFRLVFSHLKAMRLDLLGLPTACSMRARPR